MKKWQKLVALGALGMTLAGAGKVNEAVACEQNDTPKKQYFVAENPKTMTEEDKVLLNTLNSKFIIQERAIYIKKPLETICAQKGCSFEEMVEHTKNNFFAAYGFIHTHLDKAAGLAKKAENELNKALANHNREIRVDSEFKNLFNDIKRNNKVLYDKNCIDHARKEYEDYKFLIRE